MCLLGTTPWGHPGLSFGRGSERGWAAVKDGTPAVPETSSTPGAPIGAGSLYGIQRAGWLGVRAAVLEAPLEICQALHRAFLLVMPLLPGRGFCPVRRGACRWSGKERPPCPRGFGKKRYRLLLLHSLRAAKPVLCASNRVPAPGLLGNGDFISVATSPNVCSYLSKPLFSTLDVAALSLKELGPGIPFFFKRSHTLKKKKSNFPIIERRECIDMSGSNT